MSIKVCRDVVMEIELPGILKDSVSGNVGIIDQINNFIPIIGCYLNSDPCMCLWTGRMKKIGAVGYTSFRKRREELDRKKGSSLYVSIL